jgi:hypothetical protein
MKEIAYRRTRSATSPVVWPARYDPIGIRHLDACCSCGSPACLTLRGPEPFEVSAKLCKACAQSLAGRILAVASKPSAEVRR